MITLYETKTPYHEIRVVEDYPIRQLWFGKGIAQQQSGINLMDFHSHVFDYTVLAMNNLLFVSEPSDILVVGLGGGVIPMQMSHYLPNSNIDVVEIDPEIPKIAEDYFFFHQTDRIKVHIGDAFNVVPKLEKKYDIVVLDAFNKNYTPFHLMTQEFMRMVFDGCKDKGVVSVNSCNAVPQFFSQLNTIISVFGDNIYRSDGSRNPVSSTVFAVKGDIKPIRSDKFICHLFTLAPESLEITEEIKDSKIFSLNNMKNV